MAVRASTCQISKCSEPVKARGLCPAHHYRMARYGDPLAAPRLRRVAPGERCKEAGCAEPMHCKELCRLHYGRLYRTGSTDRPERSAVCLQCGVSFNALSPLQRYHSAACKARARGQRQRDAHATVTCSVTGCDRRVVPGLKDRLCGSHYRRMRLYGAPDSGPPVEVPPPTRCCRLVGCGRKLYARELCSLHYNRWRTKGDTGPIATLRAAPGEGSHVSDGGYVYVVHQSGSGGKGKRRSKTGLHRVLMEQLLGRPLLPGETVHHCNTVKDDNRTDGPLDAEFRSGNLQLWVSSQPSGGRAADVLAHAIEIVERYAPDLLARRPVQLRLV